MRFGLALLSLQPLALWLLSPPVHSATLTVGVYDNYYEPKDLTIYVGESVEWVFRGAPGGKHTVTADDRSFHFEVSSACTAPVCSSTYQFHRPGEFGYFCAIHHERGVVRVIEWPSAPPPPQYAGTSGGPPPPPSEPGASSSSYQPPPQFPPDRAAASTSPALPMSPSQTGPGVASNSTSAQGLSPAVTGNPLASQAAAGSEPAGSQAASPSGETRDGIPTIVLSAPDSKGANRDPQQFWIPPFQKAVTPTSLAVLAAVLVLAVAVYGGVMKRRILALVIGGTAPAIGGTAVASATQAPPAPRETLPGPGPERSGDSPGGPGGGTAAAEDGQNAIPGLSAGGEPVQKAFIRREGEIWAIQSAGKTIRLNHSKGLEDLSKLLLNPGREFHVLELAVGNGAGRRPASVQDDGLEVGAEDAGAILDARAKQSYRQRLRDLEEEVAEAESHNDPERASRAKSEIDFIARELAAAVGLGDKDRKAVSNLERARILVTKRIRRSIDKVSSEDQALGRHLSDCVKTGTYCVYRHDPSLTMTWES